MTVRECMFNHDSIVRDVEVYCFTGKRHIIHSDYVENIDEAKPFSAYSDLEVATYEVMDEARYDETILCNNSEKADFAEWYDDKDAKVLVIIVNNK